MKKEADMGRTDLQFKDNLRDWIAFLERLLDLGVSEEAEKEIRAVIERKKRTLEN